MLDALSFVYETLRMFASSSIASLAVTGVTAIMLGAFGWHLIPKFTRLINTRFRPTLTHYVLSAIVSALIICFTVVFAAAGYAGDAADRRVDLWEQSLIAETGRDDGWEVQMVKKTYWVIRNSNAGDDFSHSPPPGDPGFHGVPQATPQAKEMAANIFAEGAVQYFREHNSFLSFFVHFDRAPTAIWDQDRDNYWREHPNQTYNADSGIKALGQEIRRIAHKQAARMVPYTRALLVVAFVLILLIPLTLIAWGAFRDIKVFPISLLRSSTLLDTINEH